MVATKRVARIYEKHIKPLSAAERLELLAMVAEGLASQAGTTAEPPSREITGLHGLGKEIWEGIDPREYVNRLRDEWERSA